MDCWHDLRPDEYEPDGGYDRVDVNPDCSRCGLWDGGLHRVAWAEIDAEPHDDGADGWSGEGRALIAEYRAAHGLD